MYSIKGHGDFIMNEPENKIINSLNSDRRAYYQLKNGRLINTFSFLVVLVFSLTQMLQLKAFLQPRFYMMYIASLILYSVITIIIHYMFKRRFQIKKVTARIMTVPIWLLIFNVSSINILLVFSGHILHFDLLGFVYAPILFSTMFLMKNKERLFYNLSYFFISFFVIYLNFNHSDAFYFDIVLEFFGFVILVYFAGDFYYQNWRNDRIQIYNNKLIANELSKRKEEQDTIFKEILNIVGDTEYHRSELENEDNVTTNRNASDLLDKVKSIQEELRKSSDKYTDIFENVKDGIIIIDNHGVIQELNQAGKEILEIEDDNIHLSLADIVYEEDREKSKMYLNLLITKGFYTNYQGRVYTAKGNVKYLEISSSARYDENGKFLGSRDMVRDITERKKTEAELFRARNAERQFIANVSHEIRTPLNAVIGMTNLLFDTLPTPQQLEYINILNNSANFLHELISDILDISKIEAGKLNLVKSPVDIFGLVTTLFRSFQIRLEKRNIKMNLSLDPDIRGQWMVDSTILNQILYNLLGNAEKFTNEGFIELRVEGVKSQPESKITTLKFTITDTGIGIDKDNQKKVFDKFTQLDNSYNTHKIKGTGLGLTLCKQLVELQQGNISLNSRPNKGTTVVFSLPLEKVEQDEPIELNPIDSTIMRNSSINDNTPFEILIVEDNLVNQLYLSKVIESMNLSYSVASDGKEAIALVSSKKFGLILMDIQMPIMDGIEATIHIRNHDGPNRNTPIVALSAFSVSEQKSRVMDAGMDDFVTKPYTKDKIVELIKNFRNSKVPKRVSSGQTVNLELKQPEIYNIKYIEENLKMDVDSFLQICHFALNEEIPRIKSSLNESAENIQRLANWMHTSMPTFYYIGWHDFYNEFSELYKKLDELKISFSDGLTELNKLMDLMDSYLPAFRDNLEIMENTKIHKSQWSN